MQEDRSCLGQVDAGEDAKVERRVLRAILDVYPELYGRDELVRELAADRERFADRDAVERAVAALDAIGLLNVSGPLVVPSRAALRFDLLDNC
jgi:hypothetical protein